MTENETISQKIPEVTFRDPNDPYYKQVIIRTLERLSGQRKIQKLYTEFRIEPRQGRSYWQAALDKLEKKLEFDERQLDKIPREGPLLIIANHPFGITDGLTLCHLANETRGFFRIFIYDIFCNKEPEVEEHLLPLNFDETKEAIATNLRTKQEALQLLKNGGTVLIFPAGGISTRSSFWTPVTDLEWKTTTAQLVQKTKATVVPIYFHGHHGPIFHIAKQFSQTVRTSLIMREITRKIGQPIRLTIGDPIPFERMAHIKKKRDLVEFLRAETYRWAEEK